MGGQWPRTLAIGVGVAFGLVVCFAATFLVSPHDMAAPTSPSFRAFDPPDGAPLGCYAFPTQVINATVDANAPSAPVGEQSALSNALAYIAHEVCVAPTFVQIEEAWGDCAPGGACANASFQIATSAPTSAEIDVYGVFVVSWTDCSNQTSVEAVWTGSAATGQFSGPTMSWSPDYRF